MRIDEVKIDNTAYHPASGKRVLILGKDNKSEYVFVRDSEGNSYEVHCSRLDNDDWNLEDILKREG